jgi:hypothetical protein
MEYIDDWDHWRHLSSALRGQKREDSSIAELAQQCRDALKECLEIPTLKENEWATKALGDFWSWADSTNAFATDEASLGAKLAGDSAEWTNLLQMLLYQVQNCQKKG